MNMQLPLDEQSRGLRQSFIGNQQYEIISFFCGISKGTAASIAFMSKVFGPLIMGKIFITF